MNSRFRDRKCSYLEAQIKFSPPISWQNVIPSWSKTLKLEVIFPPRIFGSLETFKVVIMGQEVKLTSSGQRTKVMLAVLHKTVPRLCKMYSVPNVSGAKAEKLSLKETSYTECVSENTHMLSIRSGLRNRFME